MGLTTDQYKSVFVDHGGLLNDTEFDRVVELSSKTKRPLDQLLMEQTTITASQLLQLLQSFFGVEATTLGPDRVDPDVLRQIPEEFARQHMVIAFSQDGTDVLVAMQDPTDETVIGQVQTFVNLDVKPYVALVHDLQQALILYAGDIHERIADAAKAFDGPDAGGQASAASSIKLMNALLDAAILLGASDVHIEPYETELVLRFRIDGELQTIATLPRGAIEPLMARLKIMSALKVDQKRLPQDGRFSLKIKEQEVNFRVSTVPSLWGEKAVLRLLSKEAHVFDLSTIGLLGHDNDLVLSYLSRPHGMVLVTGPTGSGKTTTLYAFLQEISREKIDVVNISTIEDPIEYTIPRVTQIQTQPDIDLTFANGLRGLLRQDPDILMVGEIRDEETADFAVRAALVGRMLLSSLHTNDAPSAIPRLLDMGVEPYLLSSVLMLIVAQRLARTLCTYCRQSYHPDEAMLKDLNDSHEFNNSLERLRQNGIVTQSGTEELRFFKAIGCEHCNKTGYKGRTGIFEIMEISPPVQAAIAQRVDSHVIRDLAIQHGMKTMFEDGIAKLLNGEIDLRELLHAVYS